MFNLSNPLEQFQLVPLISIRIGNLDLSFTNSTFFIVWRLSVFLLLVYLATLNGGGNAGPNAPTVNANANFVANQIDVNGSIDLRKMA